jgi:glycerol-3-phosphate dehydrogenase (NAD(P)+)
VAERHPTAVTIASRDEAAALRAQALFQTPRFRVYTSDDVPGVELGGSLKNVIAIAAGVVEGLGFGYNTQAALITRGLAEITRLGWRWARIRAPWPASPASAT